MTGKRNICAFFLKSFGTYNRNECSWCDYFQNVILQKKKKRDLWKPN